MSPAHSLWIAIMLQRSLPHAVFLVCLSALSRDRRAGEMKPGPPSSTVRQDGTGYQLLRDGKPYVIRGAGGRVVSRGTQGGGRQLDPDLGRG